MPELHINGQLVTDITLGGQQVLKIEDSQGTVLYEAGPEYLCFTSLQDGSYLYGNSMGQLSIECSSDRVNWTTWDWEVWTRLNAGEKIYLRGTNPNGINHKFILSGSFAASGDLTTLLDPDGGVTELPDNCFTNLFNGCTALTTAPKIDSVTKVNQWALAGTFDGCTNLTQAPDMRNITNVGSYGCASMFYGCRSLTLIYAPKVASWNTTNFTGWVTNVSSASGEMWKLPSVTIPNGNDGKPVSWTARDYN